MNIINISKNIFNKLWFRIVAIIIMLFILMSSFLKLNSITIIEKEWTLEEFGCYLDDRIPAIMKIYDIPGANIAVIKNGKTIWIKSYGYADIKTGKKMTKDTYLRVESISKSVTAWGVMKLVEEGKIGLDIPVNKYIKSWNFPESKFSFEDITVRQLLSHSSGLPLGDFNKRYSPAKQVPSLRDSLSEEILLEREPGTSFSYSNIGFNLLELLIEDVTGLKFSEYMEKNVLSPLGMMDSSYMYSEEFNPLLSLGHDLKGRVVQLYVYPEKASGGLFSTVGDIATFVEVCMPNFHKNQKILNSKSINMLFAPTINKLGIYSLVFDSYGLGYYLENLSNGNQAISHGGQGYGWMTHFHAIPETGDGIVILTNSQRSWPFIAYILSSWARWSGLHKIGMELIIYSSYAIRILICLIWIVLFKLVKRISTNKFRLEAFYKDSSFLRIIQICISIFLLIVLLWCINKDYLFISSLFPVESFWLGISTCVFAIVLMLKTLFFD